MARAIIRRATLNSPQDTTDIKLLAEAEIQLESVLANDSLKETHATAKRLLGLVRFRLKPEQRLGELGQILLKKHSGSTLKQDLWDYTSLLDSPTLRSSDDLTDWIVTFQQNTGFGREHAIEKWQNTKSFHWLVALLATIEGQHPYASEALKATASVDPGSPGYLTVLYHRIRILSEAGQKAGARKTLDQLLTAKNLKFPRSAFNLFMSQRMNLARDVGEFVKYAPRIPAGITTEEDGLELPEKPSPLSTQTYFDADAADALNSGFTLERLKEVAVNKSFPAHLHRELVIATWVRAVLLENEKIALEMAPVLEELIPELREHIRAYVQSPTQDARTFASTFITLKYPGMRPFVGVGLSRLTRLERIDDFRDNWWCNLTTLYQPELTVEFLSERQKAEARKEISKLIKFEGAASYLSQRAIEWAKRNPEDPRVPEVLHLAVRSTRYGCTVSLNTGKLSYAAFQLLHKKYPKSEWTKKTPFWFQ